MSKVIPIALLSNLTSGSATTAYALKVTRKDAEVFGFTSSDQPCELAGVQYISSPGLFVSEFAASAGLAVDNAEVTVLADGIIVTRADILAGVWNYATWALVRYNWADPTDGVEPIGAGVLGQFRPKNGAYVAELRGLQQYLQQPVGAVSSKTCRYRLGSTSRMTGGLCMVDLGPFTVTGTLTSVTSNSVFRDSSRAEALDYFSEGVLTWTGGDNSGLSQKVKAHAADGTFTLSVPMVFDVQVGDTYSVHAGCRKRLEEDCRDKFDNVLNFGAEPHRPTQDELTSAPEANVE